MGLAVLLEPKDIHEPWAEELSVRLRRWATPSTFKHVRKAAATHPKRSVDKFLVVSRAGLRDYGLFVVSAARPSQV